jgi:putative endonuclease
MPGLVVPGMRLLHYPRVSGGYVYILASAPNGILYVGATSNLARRIYEHRNGLVAGFTEKYSVKRLVYFEHRETIQAAIQREHDMKHWSRPSTSFSFNVVRTWMPGTRAGHDGVDARCFIPLITFEPNENVDGPGPAFSQRVVDGAGDPNAHERAFVSHDEAWRAKMPQ